ncbi:MAG TPA: tRNA (guanosine(46)-N7)-methyltransferase TrmB, partial [Nautiliaceae bacterium]|nr:tRNA (guanosine(46)-N7)-methyltransferase TrmB [Nautiliaceae bacterium]
MPHIVIDKIKEINYPIKVEEVEFLFKAENLIAVKIDNQNFFIKVRKKDSGYLVKYDKITRPIISNLKKAYKSFANLNEANILFENIEGIKEKIPNKNLLDVSSNLDEVDIVEVGFGSGRHLLYLAKENPNKTILGVEIH